MKRRPVASMGVHQDFSTGFFRAGLPNVSVLTINSPPDIRGHMMRQSLLSMAKLVSLEGREDKLCLKMGTSE